MTSTFVRTVCYLVTKNDVFWNRSVSKTHQPEIDWNNIIKGSKIFILNISFTEHIVVIALTDTRGSSVKRIGMSVGVRLALMVAHALMVSRCITAHVPRALVVCENLTRHFPRLTTRYLFIFHLSHISLMYFITRPCRCKLWGKFGWVLIESMSKFRNMWR